MTYVSNQVLFTEINSLINAIPHSSKTEIDLKTQLLIRDIENNKKSVDCSIKMDLERLGKILAVGHDEQLSQTIFKVIHLSI